MLASSDFDLPKSKGKTAAKETFTDAVLWNSFKQGNELALSMLYKKHVQPLYEYGMHTCRNHELVMDSLQELFLRLWNKRETLADIHIVKPYIFKSFRRILIHGVVADRKRAASSAMAFEFMPSTESVLIEGETKAGQLKKLREGIQSLTKGQREVIYLKFFNGLSYEDIAEITETKVESVYNLISRTLDLLRDKLQAEGSTIFIQ